MPHTLPPDPRPRPTRLHIFLREFARLDALAVVASGVFVATMLAVVLTGGAN